MTKPHFYPTTATIAALTVLTGCAQAPVPSIATSPSAASKQPGLYLTVDQLKAQMFRLSAGRRLKPASWPGGAKVAVALSFDVDNATTQPRSGDFYGRRGTAKDG